MDRFLSGVAPVPPPRAAICSKTSRRESIASAASILGKQSLAVRDAGAFGVNAQATAKVLRVVLERDGCALGAHVKDVHNPGAGGGDVHPLGATCRTPIGSSRTGADRSHGRPSLADMYGALSA